jgi:hypothetical protein
MAAEEHVIAAVIQQVAEKASNLNAEFKMQNADTVKS